MTAADIPRKDLRYIDNVRLTATTELYDIIKIELALTQSFGIVYIIN